MENNKNYLTELLDTVIDNLYDGFIVMDLSGKILRVNKALLQMGGYTEDELVGKNAMKLVSIFPAKSLKKIGESFLDAVRGIKADHYTLEAKDKSGNLRILELNNSLIVDNGKKIAIAVIIRDVTEIEINKKQLEEDKNLISQNIDVINSVADPIFVKDKNHNWILLNDAFCKFMGRKREELIGKSDHDFFPKSEADVFWDKDEEVLNSEKENINEENFTDSNGKTHVIVTKKNAYRNKNGEKILVGIISDITDTKNAENKLVEKNEELEKLNKLMVNREIKMAELKEKIKKYEV